MRMTEAFPSQFIKASDLGGREREVEIEGVVAELVGRQRDRKLVVSFKGQSKRLILNLTNASRIAEITGSDETDLWAGTRIVLFPAPGEYQGLQVDTVRVKAPSNLTGRKGPSTSPLAPLPDASESQDVAVDDIPF